MSPYYNCGPRQAAAVSVTWSWCLHAYRDSVAVDAVGHGIALHHEGVWRLDIVRQRRCTAVLTPAAVWCRQATGGGAAGLHHEGVFRGQPQVLAQPVRPQAAGAVHGHLLRLHPPRQRLRRQKPQSALDAARRSGPPIARTGTNHVQTRRMAMLHAMNCSLMASHIYLLRFKQS